MTLCGSNGIIKHIRPVKLDTLDEINRGEFKIGTSVRYDPYYNGIRVPKGGG